MKVIKLIGVFVLLLFIYKLNCQTYKSPPKISKSYSAIVHVFKDSSGFQTISDNLIQSFFNQLNVHFTEIELNISICEIRKYDNYNFRLYHQDSTKPEMMAKYYEPKHINVFFVNSILLDYNFHDNGVSTQTGIIQDFTSINTAPFIIINENAQYSEFEHHFGHYLGLYHTSFFTNELERIDATNCETTGDSVCDTYADPGNIGTSFCKQNSSPLHPVEQRFYTPLIDNIMSNYKFCRRFFTTGQRRRIVEIINRNPEAHY